MEYRPEDGAATILIGAGDYHETVNVTRPGPVTLLVRIIYSASPLLIS